MGDTNVLSALSVGHAPAEARLASYGSITVSCLKSRIRKTPLSSQMLPIYTSQNGAVRFQLNWSVNAFAKSQLPRSSDWITSLKTAAESDGVRVLEAAVRSDVVQFFVSTRPDLSPSQIVRSVKSRL